MNSQKSKKYTEQAKLGIKGEAFFESIICEHAIPHHVEGLKDIGIDFICQWVHGTIPTSVFFAVQVKTFGSGDNQPIKERCNPLNRLDEFKIDYKGLWMNPSTRKYWQALNMPVYLFAVYDDGTGGLLESFYKRYTPIILKGHRAKPRTAEGFFKVNEDFKFRAFAKIPDETKPSEGYFGFARDLFIDFMRCNYASGSITYLNPKSLGLHGYPDENAIFKDLFAEYGDQLKKTYILLHKYIEKPIEFTESNMDWLFDAGFLNTASWTTDTPILAASHNPELLDGSYTGESDQGLWPPSGTGIKIS